MITKWIMIPLHIGAQQISEIEVKFDLIHSDKIGWHPMALLMEDLDGPRGNDNVRLCPVERYPIGLQLGIWLAAKKYFNDHKDEIVAETESA